MLVFIDESGYPIPSDSNLKSVLLSVCIKETDIRWITQQFFNLKERIYGKQNEIKSTNLINPKTIFKNRTHNKQYTEGVIEILEAVDSKVFAIIMDRPSFIPYTCDGMLPVQYHRLLQRIQAYCEKHNTLMAMCVFDKTDDGRDKKYATGFNNFLYRSSEGRNFDKILVSPFFVSSTVTPTIELADLCAGIVRNFNQLGLDKKMSRNEYEEWVYGLYQRVYRRTENYRHRGKILNGFYYMPERCFQREEISQNLCSS